VAGPVLFKARLEVVGFDLLQFSSQVRRDFIDIRHDKNLNEKQCLVTIKPSLANVAGKVNLSKRFS
jgi:hypothetical protein